ncbi:MAG: metallophosphoesterase [Clostridia bacterium]|nr:metallophosphoesterase [Clostridia bacterium]
MTVVKAILSNFLAFIMAIFLTAFPYKGVELPILNTAKDDCKLVVEMISDTHIEEKELIRQTFMKAGFRNLSRASTKVDAVVVAGDLTNYADEPSLAKYYEILDKYSPAKAISCAGNHDIGHAGDRNVTDISREEAKANFIRYNNAYLGIDARDTYYSYEVNGYRFIALGDICYDGGHWDAMDLGEEQLAFLDSELAAANAENKPAFVVCHWPVDGINGEETIWPGSGIDLSVNDVKSVMEKYDNVFYISGHMHAGIKSTAVDEKYDLACVETVNGVTYINLPTYGLVNSFGDPVSATGMQLEVYDDEVIIRPRNFITNAWYTNAVYTISLAG